MIGKKLFFVSMSLAALSYVSAVGRDDANEKHVTELIIVEDVKDTPQATENTDKDGSTDLSEGTNDLNKQVVRVEFIEPESARYSDNSLGLPEVEQEPQFPGGDRAMYKWLGDNLRYPAEAAENGVQGNVIVQFVITKEGNIEDVHVVRGLHPALNTEAIRLVSAMPRWQPGRINGQPLRVAYTLPVNFRLGN